MNVRLIAFALLSCAALVVGDDALAQTATAPCFEIIPARTGIEPPVPMLVDKCSGRTWLLTRGGRRSGHDRASPYGYRWTLIEAEQDVAKTTDKLRAASADKQDGKCFTFNGRKFCE